LFSASLKPLLGLLVLLPAISVAGELRVCADPNNLPYSNQEEQGFENRIAAVLAEELGDTLTYVWWAQRRGLVSNALNEGLCDLIAGTGPIPGVLLTYPPYYRSIYTAVSSPGASVITSFDDPRLFDLTVGIELVGGDGAMSLPGAGLAARGITGNVRGYTVLGDHSQSDPLAKIVSAVADHEVDVAFVWGPVAGYFAAQQPVPLTVTPLETQFDGPDRPLAFDVSMAVRLDQGALRLRLERAISARRGDIDAILAQYHVPRLDIPAGAS
jgi:mxaJ protein